MQVLVSFASIIHIILCVLIVLAVLVQQGKGAEISASFGGSSQTVFGSSGGANFFSTFTGVCAALFMITSVFLASQGGSRLARKSIMDTAVPATAPTQQGVPAGNAPIAPAAQKAEAPAAAGAPAAAAPTEQKKTQ